MQIKLFIKLQNIFWIFEYLKWPTYLVWTPRIKTIYLRSKCKFLVLFCFFLNLQEHWWRQTFYDNYLETFIKIFSWHVVFTSSLKYVFLIYLVGNLPSSILWKCLCMKIRILLQLWECLILKLQVDTWQIE